MARRTLNDLMARDAEEREAEYEREQSRLESEWEFETERLANEFYGDGPRPGFVDIEAQDDAARWEFSPGFWGDMEDAEERAMQIACQ